MVVNKIWVSNWCKNILSVKLVRKIIAKKWV